MADFGYDISDCREVDPLFGNMADYTNGKRLHMSYSFELLGDDSSAAHVRRTVEMLEARMTNGWSCRVISNHDVKRVLTRWGGDASSPQVAKLLTALVASLRGSVCISGAALRRYPFSRGA